MPKVAQMFHVKARRETRSAEVIMGPGIGDRRPGYLHLCGMRPRFDMRCAATYRVPELGVRRLVRSEPASPQRRRVDGRAS